MIFIADLIACSTCFGHHYAHHQELESIIQVVAVDTQLSAPHHTDNLKTKAPNTTGSNHLYNTLQLLMIGIIVPETCWASNKIYNKNHLLHLVVILFPHTMLHTSDWRAIPEDDPKWVETCWSCDILIVKLYVIILRIFLVSPYVDIYWSVCTSQRDDARQGREYWHFRSGVAFDFFRLGSRRFEAT